MYFKGKTELKNPDRTFYLIELYENKKGKGALKRVYLGKLVAKAGKGRGCV